MPTTGGRRPPAARQGTRSTPPDRLRRPAAGRAPRRRSSAERGAVAMLRPGASELSREVAERDVTLRAGLEVADDDVAAVHLVAADDREVGAFPRRALELLAELAAAQVG